jgi:hypothetical protein
MVCADRGDTSLPLKRIALDLVDTLARRRIQARPLRQSKRLRLAFRGHEQERTPPLVRDGNCGVASKMATSWRRASAAYSFG